MKKLTISDPAAHALDEVRVELAKLQPIKFTKRPSYSVTLEFLAWWFQNTITGSGIDLSEFSPITRNGRPMKPALISDCRPVSPSEIRKLAGVDRCGLPDKL